jgi:hypothetical protein
MNKVFSTGGFTVKLADHTISIRIAAVDTPEKGRNGDEVFQRPLKSSFEKNTKMNRRQVSRILPKPQILQGAK